MSAGYVFHASRFFEPNFNKYIYIVFLIILMFDIKSISSVHDYLSSYYIIHNHA